MAESENDIRLILTVISLGIYVVLDIISIICTISFREQYDETDSSMPSAALSAVITGFVGHLVLCASGYVCCSVICGTCCESMTKVPVTQSEDESGCERCCELGCIGCAYCTIKLGTILSSVWIGLFHLSATISMAIVTAENPASNVQAFGGFITAINGIATLLSIPYCCFITTCNLPT